MIKIRDIQSPDDCEKGMAGVYIFFENDVPAYVGVSGSGDQDLKTRIEHHSKSNKSNDSNLRKNICEIDNVKDGDALKKVKQFSTSVIIFGENNYPDIAGLSDLKKLLIKLLQPKYNKNSK